jgi:hypothetical protein
MLDGSATHRLIAADFLTPSFRLVGQIMVPSAGVVGLLNDTTTSFIEVLDAKLARLLMPTKLVGEYKVVDLVKSNITAACLTRREDVGPQAVARGGYQNVTTYPVRVTTPVYEMGGGLEWTGRFIFAAIMIDGVRDFVPLYDAVLTGTLIPQLMIESPAILFNRKHVDLLARVSDLKE